MKYLTIIKDLFRVYDMYSENGDRISREMVIFTIGIISSALVGFGVISTGVTDAEAIAIGTGILSLIGFFARLSSKGGTTKLLPPADPAVANKQPSPLDEQ